MDQLDIKNFAGGFEKQLAYNNRTFLRGYYFFRSGAGLFTVCRNGKVWEFETLYDAIKKFNEVANEQVQE